VAETPVTQVDPAVAMARFVLYAGASTFVFVYGLALPAAVWLAVSQGAFGVRP